MNTSRKLRSFGIKSDISTQPKVYDTKTKSLMCQIGLFTTCLSLVDDVLMLVFTICVYGIYIIFPCIPPEFRTKLDNIFLVPLYDADDVANIDKKRFMVNSFPILLN